MGGAQECPRALVVPWTAQGHVSGAMLVARSLAALGFKVAFVYFSSHYAKLKAANRLLLPHPPREGQLPSSQNITSTVHSCNGSSSIANGGSDASPSHGLIEVHVVEDGFAPGDMDNLFCVTTAMKDNLFNLILELREQGAPPTCLVSDSFTPWTLHVAQRAGIPRIELWTSSALAYLIHVAYLPPLYSQGIFPEKGSAARWKREPPLMLDNVPGLPPFSSELYPTEIRFGDRSNPFASLLMEISACVKYAERILMNAIPEVDLVAFQAIQAVGLPAYGIGPLVQYREKSQDASSHAMVNSGESQLNGQADCISWLNTQADRSVIYIAFGSFVVSSVEEIQEIALGLEASGTPFLWAIREDSYGGGELIQVLPRGFCDRTGERGMIIGWAPQAEVLAHKAIGGFLTHCGWNSALESLWEGVPMLCCPRAADQRLNSYYLCDLWKVGLDLGLTDTGAVDRKFVELGVKALIQEKEGFKARRKAQEIMPTIRKTLQIGGQSFSNLQKFYEDMKLLCSKATSCTSSK